MTFLYEGIHRLIDIMYLICGDYGAAIVLITITVRLCMIPLNRKQKRAMKQQQVLSQQAEEIKSKYKNNVSKRNSELEKLYQKEGTGSQGCLFTFLQFPIMIILYNGIRLAVEADVKTVLLPWVPSLLARDASYILPILTVLIQMIPQVLPYMKYFRALNLTKINVPMMLIMVFANGWFTSMIPAGIGLYYMVSGLFSTAEQIIGYTCEVKQLKACQ